MLYHPSIDPPRYSIPSPAQVAGLGMIALDFADAPAVTIPRDYSISGLVVAVICQAQRDAAAGDRSAFDWLARDGVVWAEACNMDANVIQRWVAKQRQKENRTGSPRTNAKRADRGKHRPRPARRSAVAP